MPCMKFLFVRSDVCRQLPSDSTSRWAPLLLAIQFPLLGLARDFHPLDNAHAERTDKSAYLRKIFTRINLADNEEERRQAMEMLSDLSGYSLSMEDFTDFMNGNKQIEL